MKLKSYRESTPLVSPLRRGPTGRRRRYAGDYGKAGGGSPCHRTRLQRDLLQAPAGGNGRQRIHERPDHQGLPEGARNPSPAFCRETRRPVATVAGQVHQGDGVMGRDNWWDMQARTQAIMNGQPLLGLAPRGLYRHTTHELTEDQYKWLTARPESESPNKKLLLLEDV